MTMRHWRRLLVTTWPLIGIILIGCSDTIQGPILTCREEGTIEGEEPGLDCGDGGGDSPGSQSSTANFLNTRHAVAFGAPLLMLTPPEAPMNWASFLHSVVSLVPVTSRMERLTSAQR